MWKGDEYVYTNNVLGGIAKSYKHIYDAVEIETKSVVTKTGVKVAVFYNPWAIADYKADFDMALNKLGKGRWTGEIEYCEFGDFRYFGRLQQVVIADIYGVDDGTLESMGFYQIPQLRGRAYSWMVRGLNGLPYGTHFIAKTLDKPIDNRVRRVK